MKYFQIIGDTIIHKGNDFIFRDNSCILGVSDYTCIVYSKDIDMPVIRFDITEDELKKLTITNCRKVGVRQLNTLNKDDIILDFNISNLSYIVSGGDSMANIKKTSYNGIPVEIKHTYDGKISIQEKGNPNMYLFSVLYFNKKYNSL